MDLLATGEPLPEKNRDHPLHGDYEGYRECHINPDWLLIYEKDTEIRIISLYRTGTHSDLVEQLAEQIIDEMQREEWLASTLSL